MGPGSAKYGLSYFAGKWSDKRGGSAGCTENTEVRCPRAKIRSDEDTALIQIESKRSKRICQENSWVEGSSPRKRAPYPSQHERQFDRDFTSLRTHTEKRSGRATPEIFLFFLSVPCGGSFTHVVRVHVEPHALRVSVDCLTEYLNTISLYCYSHYWVYTCSPLYPTWRLKRSAECAPFTLTPGVTPFLHCILFSRRLSCGASKIQFSSFL